MTKEEARQFGISLLEGIAKRNTGEYAENVRLAIAALTEPILVPDIDEAAEEIASDIAPTHPDIGFDECFEKIKDGIIAIGLERHLVGYISLSSITKEE